MIGENMSGELHGLIGKYRSDEESVFNTWFINNEERLKAFRSIRRGVRDVIADIKSGDFGNDYKGSSLEFVLSCITEQKQVFMGASHAFYWKPKLRIPDIYENEVDVDTKSTIALIDVIWFKKGTNQIASAFEVEKSTSIYSGILRLTDLYFSFPEDPSTLFIIIPNNREKELILQLSRPSIRGNAIEIHYILFSDLRQHCDAICMFGDSKETLHKISKVIS